MWQALLTLYLHPEHWGYQLFEKTYRHWLLISLASLLVLSAYPSAITLQAFYQQQYWQSIFDEKQQNLTQQAKLSASLQQRHQQQSQQDSQIAVINQQIKNLAQERRANITTLQWRFHQGKQIELVLEQNSLQLFALIEQLNTIETLRFKQLSLLKLNHQKQIQLSAEINVK